MFKCDKICLKIGEIFKIVVSVNHMAQRCTKKFSFSFNRVTIIRFLFQVNLALLKCIIDRNTTIDLVLTVTKIYAHFGFKL